MARLTDELMERVTAAALRLSDGRVEELVAQAQAEAEAEVKERFKSASKAALLRRAVARLEPIGVAVDRGEREDESSPGDGGDARGSHGPATERDQAGDRRACPSGKGDDGDDVLRYVYCITRSQNSPDER